MRVKSSSTKARRLESSSGSEDAQQNLLLYDVWSGALSHNALISSGEQAEFAAGVCVELVDTGVRKGLQEASKREAFWADEAVVVLWDTLTLAVMRSANASTALARCAVRLSESPFTLMVGTIAARVVDEWPLEAAPAMIGLISGASHPFAQALRSLHHKLAVSSWSSIINQLFLTRDWSLLVSVIAFLPEGGAAAARDLARLLLKCEADASTLPLMPEPIIKDVAAILDRCMCFEILEFLCASAWSWRADVAALRLYTRGFSLPPTPAAFCDLWRRCVTAEALLWFVDKAKVTASGVGYRVLLLICAMTSFRGEQDVALLKFGFQGLYPAYASEAISTVMTSPSHEGSRAQALHAIIFATRTPEFTPWVSNLQWPVAALLELAVFGEKDLRLLAVEAAKSVVMIGSASTASQIGPAFISLLRRGALDEQVMIPILAGVACAPYVTRDAFCRAMLQFILSDDSNGFFRVKPMGIAASRADMVNVPSVMKKLEIGGSLQQQQLQKQQDEQEEDWMQASSLFEENRHWTAGGIGSNRHFHARLRKMPKLDVLSSTGKTGANNNSSSNNNNVETLGVASSSAKALGSSSSVADIKENCRRFGSILRETFAMAPHCGFAVHLGDLLAEAVVPLFLQAESFDVVAYASTLPRQRERMTDDVFVDALFSQNPVLWHILDALSVVALTAAKTHRIMSNLLCHLVGVWYARRAIVNKHMQQQQQQDKENTLLLLRCLRDTQCLPSPLCNIDNMIEVATPVEMSQLLLTCWKYVYANPPKDEQYDETCQVRSFPQTPMEPFLLQLRLFATQHVEELAKKKINFQ